MLCLCGYDRAIRNSHSKYDTNSLCFICLFVVVVIVFFWGGWWGELQPISTYFFHGYPPLLRANQTGNSVSH